MIKIENLSKIYNTGNIETKALDNISFTIEKGEYVAIIGPSGSGKSTLMHILGCLDSPTLGKYFLNETDVSKLKDDQLSEIRNKEVGFIFQAYNLLARTSALKNVMLPMAYGRVKSKKREKKAKELLDLVELKNKYKNKPNELSGGQKQRVAIARALAMEPGILLADEPTGNLPTNQSEEIMQVFEQIVEKGNTLIVITHEPEIAARAKRIIRLVDGKIVMDKIQKNKVEAEITKTTLKKNNNKTATSKKKKNNKKNLNIKKSKKLIKKKNKELKK